MGVLNGIKQLFGRKNEPKEPTEKADDNENISVDNEFDIDPIYLKPLKNGLLPGEIVLMKWMDGEYPDVTFPDYFKHKYGVDADESVRKLLNMGLIKHSKPPESMNVLKVTELKDILRENNLKVSGKKAELIDRIMDNLSESRINTYINNTPLQISSTGQTVLETYYYINPAHQNSTQDGVYDVAAAIRYMERSTHRPSNLDIAWALFQEALIKYHQKNHFGLYRDVQLNMADLLHQEEKHKAALISYLDIFIIDLSGLGNSGNVSHPNDVSPLSDITAKIEQAFKDSGTDKAALINLFNLAWSRMRPSLPFHYLDKETGYQCLLAALNGDQTFVNTALMSAFENLDKPTIESNHNIKLPDDR